MKKKSNNLRICPKGHKYYKTSDCPVCPVCEKKRKPGAEFLSLISAPARRALENKDIDSLEKLSEYSEQELLDFHGFGPGSIPKLKAALKAEKLSFRKKNRSIALNMQATLP